MPGAALLRELSQADFRAELDELVAVYAAAMRPEAAQLPGRLSIMERHAGYPAFKGIAATSGDSPQVIGFAYGFRGEVGQWWHDVVRSGIIAAGGQSAATAWLADPVEIAEVHVRPECQHRGIGQRLLLTLSGGRAERTAVLSTQDDNSPARRLYHGMGFTDLLTGFSFPGGGPPYAVMGAVMPLRLAPRPSSS